MTFHVPTPVRRQRVVRELRGRRLEQGKSLDEVAEETRVPVPVLRDLEELREERLPGELLTKGFAIAYARAVGVSVTAIRAAWGSREPASERPARTNDAAPQRWPLFVLLAALVVFIVLAMLLSGAIHERPGVSGGSALAAPVAQSPRA